MAANGTQSDFLGHTVDQPGKTIWTVEMVSNLTLAEVKEMDRDTIKDLTSTPHLKDAMQPHILQAMRSRRGRGTTFMPKGRPPGSKNKPKKPEDDLPKEPKKRGRPPGSKNKPKQQVFHPYARPAPLDGPTPGMPSMPTAQSVDHNEGRQSTLPSPPNSRQNSNPKSPPDAPPNNNHFVDPDPNVWRPMDPPTNDNNLDAETMLCLQACDAVWTLES